MILKDLLSGVDVLKLTSVAEREITGVTNDSRKVKPGNIFVAVPGYVEDGAKYIDMAVEAGAVAVVSESMRDVPVDHVLVKDARRALSGIAANFYGRPSEQMTVVGITGTNGKTTTTYILKDLIERCIGAPCGLIGTNEVIIGDEVSEASRTTPESVEIQAYLSSMLNKGIKYAVMEVSSHALKLHRVDDVRFEVGVFTNLSQDHLDFHDSMEDYLDSKVLLFKMCRRGVINLDDSAAEYIINNSDCEILSFSTEDLSADVVARNIRYSPSSVEFEALGVEEIYRAELEIPGKFSVYNGLASIATATVLGVPLVEAAGALKHCRGVKGRAEVVPTGRDFTIIIDYAHTPDGLENILLTLKEFTKGRLITVFGAGGNRDRKKRPLMGQTVERYSDICIVTSDNPRSEEPRAIIADILEGMSDKEKQVIIPDRVEAIGYAIKHAEKGDVILLAGKGHETYQEINGKKNHMDEREIVRSFLSLGDS